MSLVLDQLKIAVDALRENGPGGLVRLLVEKNYNRRQALRYRRWLKTNGLVTVLERESMKSAIDSLKQRPLISIILPVYNVDERWLRRCIDSVTGQIYPYWELCIADDASTAPHVRPLLEKCSAIDPRIKVVFRPANGHISAASNSALELVTGEFTVLLDHDDELSDDALFWIANEINAYPGTAMIYSDEDLIDARGRRSAPKFKPDFSRDLFYSLNLTTHLSAYRTDLVRNIGGFRVGFEGSQDYDLTLRLLEHITEDQIRHIPRILYHWRVIEGSVAFSMGEKPYAHDRARKAIGEHFQRTGISADVLEAPRDLHRVHYRLPTPKPSVSIIISAVTDESARSSWLGDQDDQVICIEWSDTNRAALLNEAAASASGDVLVFLDSNLRPLRVESIDELARFALQEAIAIAGGRILSKDMFVEQAGLVLGDDLMPAEAHRGFPKDAPGNLSRNNLTGNFSAVSLSCMAITRRKFTSLGGFDISVASGLIDVDLCLRAREESLRITVLPHAEFVRYGGQPDRAVSDEDLASLQGRWPEYVGRDPNCNPNLKRDGSFEIL